MSTATAPNRFWGVVALALNSVLQPAGKICGGTDSPALRLSPPFQIANALSLIYHSVRLSFAVDLPYRTALGIVKERAGLYRNTTGTERRFLFRALVFIFGALPTLIKALAIRGDRVSYWLALGFFVPFVVLEFIQQLKKLPTRTEDIHANTMPAEKDLAVTMFSQMAALFALAFHIYLCLETVNLALMKSMFEVKPFKTNEFIALFSPLVAAVGSSSLKFYKSAPKESRSQLEVLPLVIGSGLLLYIGSMATLNMWGRWSEIATTILAITVVITGTLAHLSVHLCFSTLRQLLGDEDRRMQTFMGQWIALWTVTCIFLYYGYLYDAKGTYKPAWTEWLP